MIRVAIVFALVSLAAAAPAKEGVPLLESNHVRDDYGKHRKRVGDEALIENYS